MKSLEKVLKSLLFVIIVSCIVGLTGFLFKDSFAFWFVLSFVFQFLVSILFNNVLIFISALKRKEWEIAVMKEVSKNKVAMHCAHCNELNEVVLNVNDDNKFTCKSCGTENSVILNYMNAQKTNPIYKKHILTKDDVDELIKSDKQSTAEDLA
jgi:thiol-disulfide isomerase/thioredoxin